MKTLGCRSLRYGISDIFVSDTVKLPKCIDIQDESGNVVGSAEIYLIEEEDYDSTINQMYEHFELEEVCPEWGGDGFFDIDESSVHEGEVLESYGAEECKKCNGKGKVE